MIRIAKKKTASSRPRKPAKAAKTTAKPSSAGGQNKGERKLDKLRTVEALRQAAGIKAVAAQLLQVSRQTLYTFLNEHPDIGQELQQIEDEFSDLVEQKLFQAIRDGSERSIHFYLQTKAKQRGYTTRVEQTGAGGGPIEHHVEPSADDMLSMLERFAAKRVNGQAENGHDTHPGTNGRSNGHAA